VVDKALTRNVLLVAQGNNHPALFKSMLYANDIFWISGQKPDLPLRCTAKIRYRQTDQDCWLEEQPSGFRVRFDDPQRAITPGQSVVFYQSERCLGGGVIESAQ